MYLMGLDVGSSGAKAAVFSLDGGLVALARHGYCAQHPVKGAIELDPQVVLDAVHHCLEDCAQAVDASRVKALAISTQGEAVIPVDWQGNPLMNAVLTFDSRNSEEYEWFCAHTDRAHVMRQTGMPAHPMFSATKILWMQHCRPDVWQSLWKMMCFGDYIAYRLGAQPHIDYAMAARTMLFDLHTHSWAGNLLELCGIREEQLPTLCPAGTPVGKAGPALVSRGYSPELTIVSGSHDQLCCCLGAGVLKPGVAMDSLGTTESIVTVSDQLLYNQELFESNIPVYPHPWQGLYAYMTFLTSCASLLSWFKDKVLRDKESNFYKRFDAAVADSGPTQLYIQPYFAGAGTPSLDYRAQGLIHGLTLDTTGEQIYKGIMEGTCYEQRMNLSIMQRCGIPLQELRCIGGGSKSDIWLQMKANITGMRVLGMDISEAGCLGAAMLAGVGSGLLADLEQASRQFVKVKREFFPQPVVQEQYQFHFEKYQALSRQLLHFQSS